MTHSYNEDLRIGDRIAGRYEILAVVGQGSMGVVYKCRHDILGRVVAIKTLRLRGINPADDRTQKRFEREARLASRLDHPNLIGVHDFGYTAAGDPYLVMDFVSGQTLYEIMKRERYIIPSRAVSLYSQVCEGLYHAHQRGVIHRDLKPANILVMKNEDGSENVKIVDLGVAKMVHGGEEEEAEAITMTGEVCGSPIYLSPEQCMYQELDARTDIYSLGVCLYESLTGVPPLRGATVYDTIYMHVHDMPKPFCAVSANPEIPRKLEEIVFKCLAKQQNDRYETMMQLKNDLIASLKVAAEPNINVLPPESLFAGKPAAKKISGELARPAATPAPDQKQPEDTLPPVPEPSRAQVPKAGKYARPLAAGEKAGAVNNKKAKASSESVSLGAVDPLSLRKLVLLSSSLAIFGLGFGLGFAYLLTQKHPDNPAAVTAPDSKQASTSPQQTVPLQSEPSFQPKPVGVSSSSKSLFDQAAGQGKKTPAKKNAKNNNKSKQPAQPANLSFNDMEKLLDSRSGTNLDGSQNRFQAIVQRPDAARVPSRSFAPIKAGHHLPPARPMPILRRPNPGARMSPMGGGMMGGGDAMMGGGMMGGSMPSMGGGGGGMMGGGMPPMGGGGGGFMQKIKDFVASQSGGAFQGAPQQQASPFANAAPAPQAGGNEQQIAALCNEGTLLCQNGQFANACEKFRAAHSLDPSNSQVKELYGYALNSQAVVFNKSKQYAEAVKYAQKAVSMAPSKELYHNNLSKFSQNLELQKSGGLAP